MQDSWNDGFLRIGGEPVRPARVERYRVEDVFAFGPAREDRHAEHLIPIDAARPGDAQVAVPMRVSGFKDMHPIEDAHAGPVSLDGLADTLSSVESVVASASIFSTRTLPHVRELVLRRGSVAPETWGHLPALESLAVLYPAEAFDLALVPGGVRTLVLAGAWLDACGGAATFGALARLTSLERLAIRGHSRVSLAPLARLPALRELVFDGCRNVGAVSDLRALERIEMRNVRLKDLRAFGEWQRVRFLDVEHVSDLAGVEAMTSLREVRIGGRRIPSGLEHLARLPSLQRLSIWSSEPFADLSPLRALTDLRALDVALGSISGTGEVADLEFVRPMTKLTELRLAAVVRDGRLDALLGKPLTRLDVGGSFRDAASVAPTLRGRGRIVDARERPSGVRSLLEVQRGQGDPPYWYVEADLTNPLNAPSNHVVESLVRKEIRRRDPALAHELEFDSEAALFVMRARRKTTLRKAVSIVRDMVATRTT